MRRIITGERLAIRVDDRTLLAVPPMHPRTPRDIRVQIMEYVLRRQFGLAHMIAETTRDDLDGVSDTRASIASLLGQTPHRNRRGMGVAA